MKKKDGWAKRLSGNWGFIVGGRWIASVCWREGVGGCLVWDYASKPYRSLAAAKRAAEDDAREWLTAALAALPKRKAGAR